MIPSHKLLSIWLQIVTLPKYTSHVVGKYIKVSEFYFSGYVTSADNSIYYAFAITDEITVKMYPEFSLLIEMIYFVFKIFYMHNQPCQ